MKKVVLSAGLNDPRFNAVLLTVLVEARVWRDGDKRKACKAGKLRRQNALDAVLAMQAAEVKAVYEGRAQAPSAVTRIARLAVGVALDRLAGRPQKRRWV